MAPPPVTLPKDDGSKRSRPSRSTNGARAEISGSRSGGTWGETTKGDVPIRPFCHSAPCLPTSLMGRRRPILHPHVMPALALARSDSPQPPGVKWPGPPTGHTSSPDLASRGRASNLCPQVAARQRDGWCGSQLMMPALAVYPSCTHEIGRHRLAVDGSDRPTRPSASIERRRTARMSLRITRRSWTRCEQAIDLVDQAVDLGPATAPPLEVVSRVLHVHRGRDQDRVTGGDLAELFSVHGRTVANVRSDAQRCAANTTHRRRGAIGGAQRGRIGWNRRERRRRRDPMPAAEPGRIRTAMNCPECMTRRRSALVPRTCQFGR